METHVRERALEGLQRLLEIGRGHRAIEPRVPHTRKSPESEVTTLGASGSRRAGGASGESARRQIGMRSLDSRATRGIRLRGAHQNLWGCGGGKGGARIGMRAGSRERGAGGAHKVAQRREERRRTRPRRRMR